mmetsp:Transcript_22021/g.83788  ORF Transcript_22021/g.83788 Transcript_22021/m.83788 type:complete len:239 (-) Transcript_22021:217-933(-)
MPPSCSPPRWPARLPCCRCCCAGCRCCARGAPSASPSCGASLAATPPRWRRAHSSASSATATPTRRCCLRCPATSSSSSRTTTSSRTRTRLAAAPSCRRAATWRTSTARPYSAAQRQTAPSPAPSAAQLPQPSLAPRAAGRFSWTRHPRCWCLPGPTASPTLAFLAGASRRRPPRPLSMCVRNGSPWWTRCTRAWARLPLRPSRLLTRASPQRTSGRGRRRPRVAWTPGRTATTRRTP